MKVKRRKKKTLPPTEKSWWCERGMPKTCEYMTNAPCVRHPDKKGN